MRPIDVIGLGRSPEDLTPAMAEIVAGAEVLVGGRRQLGFYPRHPAQKLILASPMAEVLAQAKLAAAAGRRVVFLASGDPGFYGIGQRLVETFGSDGVVFHPNLTMVQLLAARLKISWADAQIISLHGRGTKVLEGLDEINGLVFSYTDPKHTPRQIAQWLVQSGQGERRLTVAENLGQADERITHLRAAQAAVAEFSPLNLVLIHPFRPETITASLFGNPEWAFDHQAGLITKAEVRAVLLAYLDLTPGLTVWDLGAGSGAVAVEAAGLVYPGRVAAVERRADRAAQIKANAARFGRDNLDVFQFDLPQGLTELAPPDRVFIGGGGAGLGEIIRQAGARLKPGGALVISLAALDGFQEAWRACLELGLRPSGCQVQINRFKPLPGQERQRLLPLNPVFLVRGQR